MEYFVRGHTFAAPFCSDDIEAYVEAENPEAALNKFALTHSETYPHLFSAQAFTSADDWHKRRLPIAKWESVKCQLISIGADWKDKDPQVLIKGDIVG
jgi:hypothetical protein